MVLNIVGEWKDGNAHGQGTLTCAANEFLNTLANGKMVRDMVLVK
jgi:hypothetical protein